MSCRTSHHVGPSGWIFRLETMVSFSRRNHSRPIFPNLGRSGNMARLGCFLRKPICTLILLLVGTPPPSWPSIASFDWPVIQLALVFVSGRKIAQSWTVGANSLAGVHLASRPLKSGELQTNVSGLKIPVFHLAAAVFENKMPSFPSVLSGTARWSFTACHQQPPLPLK